MLLGVEEEDGGEVVGEGVAEEVEVEVSPFFQVSLFYRY